MRKAVYAGSFDPPTLGHLDIIQRVAPLFERLYVVIAENASKTTMFTALERVQLLNRLIEQIPIRSNIEVCSYSGLTVQFCQEKGAGVLVRGLRAISDFEKEFQMASMNRQLCSDVETLHMMTDERYFFVSSSLVKEIARHGGSLGAVVPPIVEQALVDKMKLKER